MKTRLIRFALLSALAIMLLPAHAAFAQEHAGEEEAESHGAGGTSFIGGPNWDDVQDVTIWSLVSIAAGGTLLGVLYLFKRKIGAFPANPSWVAPITIMPASELPGDEDDGHGHAPADAHGHAPAH